MCTLSLSCAFPPNFTTLIHGKMQSYLCYLKKLRGNKFGLGHSFIIELFTFRVDQKLTENRKRQAQHEEKQYN